MLDETISPECLKDSNPELAIGLVTSRALIMSRARELIGDDLDHIHGKYHLTASYSSVIRF